MRLVQYPLKNCKNREVGLLKEAYLDSGSRVRERMKVYKDYFKQILTGLMHIFIEHSDLLRCHTWDFGVFIQVRSIMKT